MADDPEQEAAATKIQAVQRAKQAKAEVLPGSQQVFSLRRCIFLCERALFQILQPRSENEPSTSCNFWQVWILACSRRKWCSRG